MVNTHIFLDNRKIIKSQHGTTFQHSKPLPYALKQA